MAAGSKRSRSACAARDCANSASASWTRVHPDGHLPCVGRRPLRQDREAALAAQMILEELFELFPAGLFI